MQKCSIFLTSTVIQILKTQKSLNQFQKFKKLLLDLHIGFIFCFMAFFVEPIQPPLDQPLSILCYVEDVFPMTTPCFFSLLAQCTHSQSVLSAAEQFRHQRNRDIDQRSQNLAFEF